MRRSSAGLLSGVSRLIAAVTLLGVLVVLPLLVWRGVGGVGGSESGGIDWRGSLGSGRIDADTVVALGLIVFSALWVWFALTAGGEIARVVAWHRHPTATLAPVPPSPSGAIRRLVRAALVSTSAVMGAGLVSLTGVSGARAAAMTPVAAVSPPAMSFAWPASFTDGHGAGAWTPAAVRSSGRDTPYSVAVRLGDPQLREQIIVLNHGATAPDGSSWTGGVFPAGMVVEVPEGVGGPRPMTWEPYAVEEGDSVYRIAAHLANGDNRRVRDLADAIIDRNLGRVMLDGRVFDDPSLIRIGWLLDVPAASEPAPSDQVAPAAATWDRTHVVRPGESYWSIAEQHIDPPADAGDVAHLARDLQAHNAPLLGYSPAAMLHPGDPVELPEPSSVVAPAMVPVPVAVPVDDPSVDHPSVDHPSMDNTSLTVVAANDPNLSGDTEPGKTPPVLELPPRPIVSVERDMVPPVSTPSTDRPSVGVATQVAPDAAAGAEAGAEGRSPVTTSLAAAVLLCAGALGLVESRRRQQLRRAGTNSRAPQPTPREVEIERLVRSLDAAQRAVRLDLALRVAGHLLVGTGGFVLGAIVAHDGGVTLLLDRPGRSPSGPWSLGAAADRWELSATTPNEELAPLSRLAGQPCPALVHLGRVAVDTCEPSPGGGGELFLDLEAFGLVCIDADTDGSHRGADAILRAIAASLAASPVGETLRLITHDLDPAVHLGNDNAESARDFDEAIDMAASALGSTPTAIGHRRTSELRARGIGGEAWEPVVVVSAADHHEPAALRELLDVTRGGGRGLAVVLRHAVDGASLTVRATTRGWQMERLGLTVVPVGLDEKHVIDLHDLLSAAAQPVDDVELTARHATVLAHPDLAHPDPLADPLADPFTEPFTEPAWSLLVRVLGGVDVVDRDGAAVAFERGKSLELVAWLSQHRDQATRGGARAALWDLDVRDATFANVVSDARRSLGRAVAPAEGDEWIARTLTDQLPMHPRVVTDADLLRCRLDHSRRLGHREAIETLRPGVALIRDLPFSGTDFLWPDAEGITSSLTLLATSAATELARHHLTLGDIEGVFWATGHGLRALPGHEELIGLRMRAHAHCGDLAGVRQEWEGYERAITADPWSDGEPSPKLLSLRRQLLSA